MDMSRFKNHFAVIAATVLTLIFTTYTIPGALAETLNVSGIAKSSKITFPEFDKDYYAAIICSNSFNEYSFVCSTATNVFSVRTCTTYYVAATGDPDNTGVTSDSPLPTIESALAKAVSGDMIEVASGTYTPAATIALDKVVTIYSATGNPDDVIIDGANNKRVMTMTAPAVLSGLTIQRGYSDAGANISMTAGTITNCIVQNSYNFDDGWLTVGIYMNGRGCLVVDSIVRNNRSQEGDTSTDQTGGGIFSAAGTVLRSVITNNYSRACGGGIGCLNTADTLIKDCVISKNRSGNPLGGKSQQGWSTGGGGVYKGTLLNCLVTSNVVEEGNSNQAHNPTVGGGGLYKSTAYNCTIVGNSVSRNNSASDGGGAAESSLYNCIVYGNTDAYTGTATDEIEPVCVTASCCMNDPCFTNSNGFAYALTEDSPCYDSGDAALLDGIAVDTDIMGNPRFCGQIDIGCFELAAFSPAAVMSISETGYTTVRIDSTLSFMGGESTSAGLTLEFSDDPEFGTVYEQSVAQTYSGPLPVSFTNVLTALNPDTTYYVRLHVVNDAGNETITAAKTIKTLSNPFYVDSVYVPGNLSAKVKTYDGAVVTSVALEINDVLTPVEGHDGEYSFIDRSVTDEDAVVLLVTLSFNGQTIVDRISYTQVVFAGPEGDDNASGASPLFAKCSLQAALNDAFNKGFNTVIVLPGLNYVTNTLVVNNMTLKKGVRYADHEAMIIRSPDAPACSVVAMTNSVLSGLTITGGVITNDHAAGVRMFGGVLSGCIVSNNVGSFTGNAGPSGGGMGLSGSAMVTNCIIIGNTNRYGGGIQVWSTSGRNTICNSLITGNHAYQDGGGIRIDNADSGFVFDCVVSNNTVASNVGGGIQGGRIFRCIISDNTAPTGAGVYGANLYDCLIAGNNSVNEGAGVRDSTMYNCTVTGNTSRNSAGGVSGGSSYNSIVWNNFGKGDYYNRNSNIGTMLYTCTEPYYSGTGNISANPQLNADFTLGGSPCIDAGNNSDTTVFAYASYRQTDLAGNQRITGNKVDMGCFERQTVEFDDDDFGADFAADGLVKDYVIQSHDGSVSFTARVLSNTNTFNYVWDFGDGITVTNISSALTDNVTHTFAPGSWYDVTLTVIRGDGSTCTVLRPRHVLSQISNATIYAGKSGSDWNTGLSPDTPKSSIPAAVLAAGTNCTIIVGRGRYDIGEQINLPPTVSICGVTGNPEDVIIRRTSGNYRVLWVSTNCVVSGITVREGCSENNKGTGYASGIYLTGGVVTNCIIRNNYSVGDNHYGAGVYVESGLVADCLIFGNYNRSGSSSYPGGGVYLADTEEAVLVGCVVSNNACRAAGGGVGCGGTRPLIRDCLIVNNRCAYGVGSNSRPQGSGGAGVLGGTVVNSLIAGNYSLLGNDNKLTFDGAGLSAGIAYNCTITGNAYASCTNTAGGACDSRLVNCIVYGNTSNDCENVENCEMINCSVEDPQFEEIGGFAYAIKVTSPSVNAGNDAEIAELGILKDLAGNLRVIGASVDIGCYEAAVGGAAAPIAEIEAEVIDDDSARLSYTVASYGSGFSNAVVTLQISTDSDFGEGTVRSLEEIPVSGSLPVSGSEVVSDLYASRTYYARAVVSNTENSFTTRVVSFITAGFVTGGVISSYGSDTIHTFTENGTFTVPEGRTVSAEILVVGGGGAGGTTIGGGGAGGQVVHTNFVRIPAGVYQVSIGAGGVITTDPNKAPEPGACSSFFGITAGGGGAGRSWNNNSNRDGANGGGGSNNTAGGVSTNTLGYAGGGSTDRSGGGGGGSGGVGLPGTKDSPNYATGGNGGSGVVCNITGEAVSYGAGGGGGARNIGSIGGLGGSEYAGHGAAEDCGNATPGRDGTGSGGGGGSCDLALVSNNGANGGCGVVIIRYSGDNDAPYFGNVSVTIADNTSFDLNAEVMYPALADFGQLDIAFLYSADGDSVTNTFPVITTSSSADTHMLLSGLASYTAYTGFFRISYGNGLKVDSETLEFTTFGYRVTAYGGSATVFDGRFVRTFDCSGILKVEEPGLVDVFIVGGGGGGGRYIGGGGAGGTVLRKRLYADAGEYEIVIGAGGAAASARNVRGGNGGDSSAFGLTAPGGGGGGSWDNQSGSDGGNGGGASRNWASGKALVAGGFSGGRGIGNESAGGGGGAAGIGLNGTHNPYIGGNGGPGVAYDITGEEVYYGAGGGSGSYGTANTSKAGLGGSQWAGHGGGQDLGAATPGVDGTGSGGGGGVRDCGSISELGAAGGSGIVFISYTTVPEDPVPVAVIGEVSEIQPDGASVGLNVCSFGCDSETVRVQAVCGLSANDLYLTNECAAALSETGTHTYQVRGLSPASIWYVAFVITTPDGMQTVTDSVSFTTAAESFIGGGAGGSSVSLGQPGFNVGFIPAIGGKTGAYHRAGLGTITETAVNGIYSTGPDGEYLFVKTNDWYVANNYDHDEWCLGVRIGRRTTTTSPGNFPTLFPINSQYVYWGGVYMTSGETFTFAEYWDDSVIVKIDGEYVIYDTTGYSAITAGHPNYHSWAQPGSDSNPGSWAIGTFGTHTAQYTGWHPIEIYIGQNDGGMGINGGAWNTWGYGLGYTNADVSASLATQSAIQNPPFKFKEIYDPGDASVFCTEISSAREITLVSSSVENNAVTAELSIADGICTSRVYMVTGASYGGTDTNQWDTCTFISDVPDFNEAVTVNVNSRSFPAGTKFIRFVAFTDSSDTSSWTESINTLSASLPGVDDSISVDEIDGDTATVHANVLSLGAGDSATGEVLYGITPDLGQSVAYNGTITGPGAIAIGLTGLVPETVYYYAVKIRNSIGREKQTAVSSFTTLGSAAVSSLTCSRNLEAGNRHPVYGCTVTDMGAGHGHAVLILYTGTDAGLNTSTAYSRLTETARMDIYATGTYQFDPVEHSFTNAVAYKISLVNTCAGMAWTNSLSATYWLGDTTAYTWNGGSTGDWNDTNNWTHGTSPDAVGYPTYAAAARFPAGNCVTVLVHQAERFSYLEVNQNGVDLTLRGDSTNDVFYIEGSLSTSASSAMTFDHLNVYSPGSFTFSSTNRIELLNESVLEANEVVMSGNNGKLRVDGGSTLKTRSNFRLQNAVSQEVLVANGSILNVRQHYIPQSSNSVLIVDNSLFDNYRFTPSWDYGHKFSGTLRFQGANPRLLVAERMYMNQLAEPMRFEFAVPERGYDSTVITHTGSSSGHTFMESATQTNCVVEVLASSPIFKSGRVRTVHLIDWNVGINTSRVVLTGLPLVDLDAVPPETRPESYYYYTATPGITLPTGLHARVTGKSATLLIIR